jgi:hypothetical protein
MKRWILAASLLLLPLNAYAQEGAGPCPADGGLDYYRCRADDHERRHPALEPPSYYMSYGDRYMRRFTFHTRPLLSPTGQVWLDDVREGLQGAMEEHRAADPVAFARLERDPEAFLDFAYDTHPAAYMEAGLSQLPLRDLVLIGSTPDAQDLLSKRGRAQILTVLHGLLGACVEEGVARCLVTRVLRELRDRRRLIVDRLRMKSTGFLGGWLIRRLVDSAVRTLRGEATPDPEAEGLPLPTAGSTGAAGRVAAPIPAESTAASD